ncbi:hypothetical protein J1N35_006362 [Gossypium stocksii]|uniref:Phytosulfokine n=1 Tax=Gossypium stocksii TaxID=47602 RepID=A0A9D3WGD7_9ROSI|nr:hypothetical protein J1N35_006362 [Gossypium stocksii]
MDWPCLFGIIMWCIWKNRNLFIFQGISWSTDEIINISYSWVKQYSSILRSSLYKARDHLHSWPLPNSWVRLSTDGSVKFDEGFASSGGFVEDHNGEWIIEFVKYLGNCTLLEAELREFWMGLILFWIDVLRESLFKLKELKAYEMMMIQADRKHDFSELMGAEECYEKDEECVKRRMMADAHLDYIYTQNHKP